LILNLILKNEIQIGANGIENMFMIVLIKKKTLKIHRFKKTFFHSLN
jgi:hypothetical protein